MNWIDIKSYIPGSNFNNKYILLSFLNGHKFLIKYDFMKKSDILFGLYVFKEDGKFVEYAPLKWMAVKDGED